MELSVLLLVLQIILISWRSFTTEGDQSHPVYFIMMMILTPVVLLLGYYGGQMTFPAEK
jgi:cytochrome c biogenesis factor